MKVRPGPDKLRGGFYTPMPIAELLASWALRGEGTRVLEPSCGDGVFLQAAAEALLERGLTPRRVAQQITGVEFERTEVSKVMARLRGIGISPADGHVIAGDFFGFCSDAIHKGVRFDAVVGNPPFIRYQDFREEHRAVAFSIMEQAGLQPNRLTNAWVPFLVASTLLLAERGRLAMVVPAELFQVNYAAATRAYLARAFGRVTLVTVNGLLFKNVQQEVVLLLAEKASGAHAGIRTIELDSVVDLGELRRRLDERIPPEEMKPLNHPSDKWTMYFLSADEIGLLGELGGDGRIPKAADFYDVDVGVVTGQNDFFIMSREQVLERGLVRSTAPVVARSSQLGGLIFSPTDLRAAIAANERVYLFHPPEGPKGLLLRGERTYVEFGEKAGFNQGYKCRIREHWFDVPSVWKPDAFMLRQVHSFPKLVLNSTLATCTDTLHRVRFRPRAPKLSVVAGFINSLTLAVSEVTGRSYGGGVLTFEPSEAERLPVPVASKTSLPTSDLDSLIRTGRVEDALDITDGLLLRKGLGLSVTTTRTLRCIWRKLRDRRNRRGRIRVLGSPKLGSKPNVGTAQVARQAQITELN